MRQWQSWQRNLIWASRQNPPQLVEGVMLLLALVLCAAWFVLHQWQYLVFCLSYIAGAIASILVRESISPSTNAHHIRLTALFSLALLITVLSFYLMRVGLLGQH